MPRKSQKAKRRKTAGSPASPDRRQTLTFLRNGAIVAVVLGGVGAFSVRAVRATISEQDLTRLGQGAPTIVQIHDPTCSMCTELQRNTRRALNSFEADKLNYLVANIRTGDGAAFAAEFGARHVTLLLFDGEGQHQGTLEGVRPRGELEEHFRALLDGSS